MVRTELAAVARVGLPLRQRFVVHALLAPEQHLTLFGREQPQDERAENVLQALPCAKRAV